jgi:hypothetical protein
MKLDIIVSPFMTPLHISAAAEMRVRARGLTSTRDERRFFRGVQWFAMQLVLHQVDQLFNLALPEARHHLKMTACFDPATS